MISSYEVVKCIRRETYYCPWSEFHFNPLSPHDELKYHFISLKTDLIFLQLGGFRMNISMKMVYRYVTIFFTFSPTSNHIHPLQVENCDSNSRLVVDEDGNVKSGLKGLNMSSDDGAAKFRTSAFDSD